MSQLPSTVWEMIAAAASGSATARAEFAQQYGAMIRAQLAARWQRTMLLPHLDDAQQEVFVECLKPGGVLARADHRVQEGFRALLGAVVRNVALRFEARHHRHRQRQDGGTVSQAPAEASSVGRSLDRRWALELLREAAREQGRRAEAAGAVASQRVDLLRLHFEDGMSIPAIAAHWGREASYVHHQYAKARADFLRALLAVLRDRYPQASLEQLRHQGRHLVQLLQSG